MKKVKKFVSFVTVAAVSMLLSVCVMAEEQAPTTEVVMSEGEEVVIIDNENCTMKLTGIEPDGEWGYTWMVYLENKTDMELMFDIADVSVNGLMCDPFWATTVVAGMNSNEEIFWDAGEFELYGINDVTEVEFTLNVYDNNDFEAENIVYEDYIVYPAGKDAAVSYTREAKDTDIIWFDTDECSMMVTGFEEDGVWGKELNIYFENKSERDLLVSFEDVAVNGSMCDPYWGIVVTAGNKAYSAISWMDEDLEASGIEVIEDIQGTMYVYDNYDWEADALVEEQVAFTVAE